MFNRLDSAGVTSGEFDNKFFHLLNVTLALEGVRAYESWLELFETLFTVTVSLATSLVL